MTPREGRRGELTHFVLFAAWLALLPASGLCAHAPSNIINVYFQFGRPF